jgi:hypothetical protein
MRGCGPKSTRQEDSTQYTVHSTQYTVHSTQDTVHEGALQIVWVEYVEKYHQHNTIALSILSQQTRLEYQHERKKVQQTPDFNNNETAAPTAPQLF